jgi:hypothetical protein
LGNGAIGAPNLFIDALIAPKVDQFQIIEILEKTWLH